MTIQYSSFALELLFFAAVAFDSFFKGRGVGWDGIKRCYHFLVPAVFSILLLSSSVYFSSVSWGMPASDILCSLLLTIFLKRYSESGCRYASYLALALLSVCLAAGAARVAGVTTGAYRQVYSVMMFFPLVPVSFMTMYVALSVKDYFNRKKLQSEKYTTEQLVIYMLFLSAFFFISFFATCGFAMTGMARKAFGAFSAIIALGLYFFHYLNSTRGFVVSRILKGRSIVRTLSESDEKDNRNSSVKELYDRIIDLFETEKPYLNDGITIGKVARMLFTNKVYVSRAINDFTGKNFCQFVNHYRIMYAIRLFKENPYLKTSDLSDMSGFHTLSSYNMAFRLVMNESPGEWCKKMRTEKHSKDKKS